MEQVLSVEQMQHLQELGIDTSNASMISCCIRDGKDYEHFLLESKYRFYEGNAIAFPTKNSVDYCKSVTPAYTLQDVLELLPDFIEEYCLIVDMGFGVIRYDNLTKRNSPILKETYFNDEDNKMIDSAYEMLCWCIEQGYVKTGKENKK